MLYIVQHCSLTKLNGGLKALNAACTEAVTCRYTLVKAGAGGGDPSFVCDIYEREYHSRIGLVGNSRTHRTLATDLVILFTEGL